MQLRRTTHARVSAHRSRQTGACATMPRDVFVVESEGLPLTGQPRGDLCSKQLTRTCLPLARDECPSSANL